MVVVIYYSKLIIYFVGNVAHTIGNVVNGVSDDSHVVLKYVAAMSGVSIISASRVMRDVPNVSSELREKVVKRL
jgi:hypothetical protein